MTGRSGTLRPTGSAIPLMVMVVQERVRMVITGVCVLRLLTASSPAVRFLRMRFVVMVWMMMVMMMLIVLIVIVRWVAVTFLMLRL